METTNIFEQMSQTELVDDDENTVREVNDALADIRQHLTKEELLLFSLYKNSKKQSNQIPKLFLEKYHGKKLTSSAISKRKKRLFKVLLHVGELIRFKNTYNIDYSLKQILTKKQYLILMLYERRVSMKEIWALVYSTDTTSKWTNTSRHSYNISRCFYAAIERLKDSTNKDVLNYLDMLTTVLSFSRKYPIRRQT